MPCGADFFPTLQNDIVSRGREAHRGISEDGGNIVDILGSIRTQASHARRSLMPAGSLVHLALRPALDAVTMATAWPCSPGQLRSIKVEAELLSPNLPNSRPSVASFCHSESWRKG